MNFCCVFRQCRAFFFRKIFLTLRPNHGGPPGDTKLSITPYKKSPYIDISNVGMYVLLPVMCQVNACQGFLLHFEYLRDTYQTASLKKSGQFLESTTNCLFIYLTFLFKYNAARISNYIIPSFCQLKRIGLHVVFFYKKPVYKKLVLRASKI